VLLQDTNTTAAFDDFQLSKQGNRESTTTNPTSSIHPKPAKTVDDDDDDEKEDDYSYYSPDVQLLLYHAEHGGMEFQLSISSVSEGIYQVVSSPVLGPPTGSPTSTKYYNIIGLLKRVTSPWITRALSGTYDHIECLGYFLVARKCEMKRIWGLL